MELYYNYTGAWYNYTYNYTYKYKSVIIRISIIPLYVFEGRVNHDRVLGPKKSVSQGRLERTEELRKHHILVKEWCAHFLADGEHHAVSAVANSKHIQLELIFL